MHTTFAAVNAACVVATFPEQGWSLLGNDVITFDDIGDLRPDRRIVRPYRGPAPHLTATH